LPGGSQQELPQIHFFLSGESPPFLKIRVPIGPGRTQLEIIHHGFERLGERAAEIYRSFEGGWDLSELEALKRVVEAA
jgi:hypothetical protein